MLTSGELAAIQREAAALLPDICTIRRGAFTPDGAGGQSATFTTIASGVACRLKSTPDAGGYNERAERLTVTATCAITLPVFTDVKVEDLIDLGSKTYQVKFVDDKSWKTVKRTLCAEL